MEWGQQMKKHEIVANDSMYQNPNYFNNREKIRSLILYLADYAATSNHNSNSMFESDSITFSVDLQEPLIIDTLSDIYINFVLTFNSVHSEISNNSAFIFNIDQFNINSNSNESNIFNNIYIPNEDNNSVPSVTLHKSKKLNYICSINPCKITKLSGKITLLDGSTNIFKPSVAISNLSNITITTGNSNTANSAADLGIIEFTAYIEFLAITGTATANDYEMFMFRTNSDGSLTTITASGPSGHDGQGAYMSLNDDHGTAYGGASGNSILQFTNIQEGQYYLMIGPYDTEVGVTPTASNSIDDISSTHLTFTNGWTTDGTHLLRINTNSGTPSFATIGTHSVSGEKGVWYKFIVGQPQNLITEFNIIERE